MNCYRHPSVQTLLACGLCEQPVCVDCVQHTTTGTKCQPCVTGATPSPASSPELLRRYQLFAAGLLLTCALALVAAPLMVVGLLAAVALVYRERVDSAVEFAVGALYFLGFAIVLLLLFAGAVPVGAESVALDRLDVSAEAAVVAVAGAVGVWYWLLRPARECATVLLKRGSGLKAGLCAGAGLAASIWCIAAAALFVGLAA